MQLGRSGINLISLECIECFVSIPDKGKTHFGLLFLWHSTCEGSVGRGCVFLWDLVDGEIGDIDVRGKAGFKWSTDSTQLFPDDTAEERMVFDLISATMGATVLANAVFCIAEETMEI